jgi:hypothetical protein
MILLKQKSHQAYETWTQDHVFQQVLEGCSFRILHTYQSCVYMIIIPVTFLYICNVIM